MKFTTRDALAVLRLYNVADVASIEPDISRFSSANPSPTNLLLSFVFQSTRYVVLFDASIHDDEAALSTEIAKQHPGTTLTFIANPRSDSLAAPYHGKQCYLATLNDHTERLDKVLARERPEYSRSSLAAFFIKDGKVQVDGETVQSPRYAVSPTQQLTYSLQREQATAVAIPIIYQDDDVIVLDKPAGMLTHAKNERDDEYTVETFMRDLPQNTLAEVERHGIVHRLDRDTSGVIICALNRKSYDSLKQQFADRSIKKTYIAITSSIPKHHQARVDIPIARSASKPGTFVCNQQGKPAETFYMVEATSSTRARIRVEPYTGRTHQIRVHLQYIGAPIVGDRLYGTVKPADRLYLHAHKISVELATGRHTFTSPVPPAFEQELARG